MAEGFAEGGESIIESGSLQTELLKSAVDDYYDAFGQEPDVGRNYANFELDSRGTLRLKNNPDFNIINVRTKQPLALSTLAGKPGGANIIREELGFVDWRRKNLKPQTVAALQKVETKLSEEIEMDDFSPNTIDEVLKTIDDPPLDGTDELGGYIRELKGLDKAMQRQRGNLSDNLSKLSHLDEEMSTLKIRIQSAELADKHESEIKPLRLQLDDLNIERAARLEAISTHKEALRSQISRMRETIRRILEEDTTLAERIRTLFREQGITIVSILTAFGMIISTIVLAVTGGGGTPRAPGKKDDNWIRKRLKDLGELLKKLGLKAIDALPGVIGAIVSWLLSTLGKAVGWLANNLWALVLGAGLLLFDYLKKRK